MHGATPWQGAHQRRIAIYRFAPANMGYGRGCYEYTAANLERLTPLQRAVLEHPYGTRLERPLVTDAAAEAGGDPVTRERNAAKKDLDEQLFGTKYF